MAKRGKFDYILLETTGLADPGNLAPLFWVDEGLASTIYLDGIVTLVDAKNILKSLDDPAGKVDGHDESDHHGPVMTTAHVQISHADVIVINKTDLVSEQELQAVQDRIRSINGLAKLHLTKESAVPQLEGFLLDLHAYENVVELDNSKGHSHLDSVSHSMEFFSTAVLLHTIIPRSNLTLISSRRYQQYPYRSWCSIQNRWAGWMRGSGQFSGKTCCRTTAVSTRTHSRFTV